MELILAFVVGLIVASAVAFIMNKKSQGKEGKGNLSGCINGLIALGVQSTKSINEKFLYINRPQNNSTAI